MLALLACAAPPVLSLSGAGPELPLSASYVVLERKGGAIQMLKFNQ